MNAAGFRGWQETVRDEINRSNTRTGTIPIQIITISTYFSYSVDDGQAPGWPDLTQNT